MQDHGPKSLMLEIIRYFRYLRSGYSNFLYRAQFTLASAYRPGLRVLGSELNHLLFLQAWMLEFVKPSLDCTEIDNTDSIGLMEVYKLCCSTLMDCDSDKEKGIRRVERLLLGGEASVTLLRYGASGLCVLDHVLLIPNELASDSEGEKRDESLGRQMCRRSRAQHNS